MSAISCGIVLLLEFGLDLFAMNLVAHRPSSYSRRMTKCGPYSNQIQSKTSNQIQSRTSYRIQSQEQSEGTGCYHDGRIAGPC
jgi:hypothetical protein